MEIYRSRLVTRRELLGVGLSGLGAILLPSFYGCGTDSAGGGGRSNDGDEGTGVPDLDTPNDILSNPYVDDLVDAVRDEGYSLNLSRELDPPVISGRYSISGYKISPDSNLLAPGTFRWRNQTSDNHIDTDYEQITGQSGISSLGEIIRGEDNEFTVYSILRVNQSGCEEDVIFIVDGRQISNGDVSAVYMGTPSDNPKCFVPTAGVLELELTGAGKYLNIESNPNDLVSLITLKRF